MLAPLDRAGWSVVGIILQILLFDVAAVADDSCVKNQATLNDCAEETAGKEEAAMNAAYQAAQEALRAHPTAIGSEAMRESLIAAQDAWIASRDATCAFDAMLLSQGGSLGLSLRSQCLGVLNSRRRDALEKLTDCLKAPACKVPVALHQFQIRLDTRDLNWE